MTIRVERYVGTHAAVWQTANADGAFVFHRPEYLEVLNDFLVHESPSSVEQLTFVALESDVVLGHCTVFVSRNAEVGGTVINSLPLAGGHGGPVLLTANEEVAKALLASLRDLADELNALSTVVVTNPLQPLPVAVRASFAPDLVMPRITQIVTLPPGERAESMVMERMHGKTRNLVRKGLRVGLRLERTRDRSTLLGLAEIHARNMAAMGVAPKPSALLERLWEHLGERALLYGAWRDERLLAAMLCFRSGPNVDYYTPAVEADARDTQALPALIYTGMCDAAREGAVRWNFGGTALSNVNLHHFKSRFGADDVPYEAWIRLAPCTRDMPLRERAAVVDAHPYFFTLPHA